MAKAIVRLLPGGAQQILRGASGLQPSFVLNGFVVGDAAAFTPADTDTVAQGNIVFTGTPDLMSHRQLPETGNTRITLTIPEGVGPFQVGNLMLYTNDLVLGTVPFAEVVLPFQITKHLAQYNEGQIVYANPGDRLLVSITLNHRILQPDDPQSGITVVVDILAPQYTSLPFYDTEANVPDASLIPWAQFIINHLLSTGGPGFVTKRSDNSLWVEPIMKNIHDPDYHVLSGGSSGDQYAVDQHDFLWGGRFVDRQVAGIQRASVGGMPFVGYTPGGASYYGGIPFVDISRGQRAP